MLALAGQSRAEGLPYLYLGYWVAGSRKMDYKARYGPLEAWDGRRWRKDDTLHIMELALKVADAGRIHRRAGRICHQ